MKQDFINRLRFVQNGGSVRRFHTVRTIEPNTVAEHSFGVAWLVWILTEGQARARLLMASLAHDLAEQEVGDVPAPAKRALGIGPDINELEDRILAANGVAFVLTPEEQRTMKLADCLDGMLYCAQERKQGNKFVDEAFEKYHSYVTSMNPQGVEREVFDAVITMNEEARK